MAVGAGPTATENQLPCRTLMARLTQTPFAAPSSRPLPSAVWVSNGSIAFTNPDMAMPRHLSRHVNPSSHGFKVPTIDISDYLVRNFRKSDFVVCSPPTLPERMSGRGSGWDGGGRGGRDLLEFPFRRGGGGDPSPLDPLPPSPLSSSAAENLGFGNFFW